MAVLDKDLLGYKAGQSLVILSSEVVRERVAAIPAGSFCSVASLREEFAREYGADGCCPLTFGIFLRIVSEAAWDEVEAGASTDAVTPFWRVVEPGSPLAKKLRCDREWLEGMLSREVSYA